MPTTNYAIPYFSGSAAADDVAGTSQPALDAVDSAIALTDGILTKATGAETATGTFVGTVPPAGTRLKAVIAPVSGSTDAGGSLVFNYGYTFPNGVVGVWFMPLNRAANTIGSWQPASSNKTAGVLSFRFAADFAVAATSAQLGVALVIGW